MRPPLVPTLLVALAVAAMIGLGIWQLQRGAEKQRLLAELAANAGRPPVTYPELGPLRDADLFRRSSILCLEVTGWSARAGRAADGSSGYARLARCRTGAEGPGAVVLAGVAPRPDSPPAWTGGEVAGTIMAQSEPGLLASIGLAQHVREPMLVSAEGLGGLRTPAKPSVASVPDNHRAYAVQWFLFAGGAVLIYVLALRKRSRQKAAEE